MADLDPKEVENAVYNGLQRALSSEQLKSLIAGVMAESSMESDRRESSGGKGTANPRASDARWLRQSIQIGNERFSASPQSPPRDEGGVHNAGDGPSGHASVAGDIHEEYQQKQRGPQPADQAYSNIPPGFGHFLGNPSMTTFFETRMARAAHRIENSAEDSYERTRAVRSFERAANFKNQVVPALKFGKQIYQQAAQPAYKALQGFEEVGASQLGGEAVSGGVIGSDEFGLRLPFNNAASKGIEMKFDQIERAMAPGLTMKQAAEVDSKLMGMGFNYDNERFKLGQAALDRIVKYNPSINIGAAAQLGDQIFRYGTTEEVAKFSKTITDLGGAAKTANTSTEELLGQIGKFQSMSNLAGGTAQSAAQNVSYLASSLPGMDATQIFQSLQSSPMGMQAAMEMGYMPHQVGAMSGQEMTQAFMTSINRSTKQVGLSKPLTEYTREELNNPAIKKKIADLQGLYGYSNVTTDQFMNIIGNAKNRESADATLNQYFDIDPATGQLRDPNNIQTKGINIQEKSGFFGLDKWKELDRAEFNRIAKGANIRRGEANDLAKKIFEDGKGGEVKEGWEKTLYDALQAHKTGDIGAPTDDLNKLVKAMEQATQAAKGIKANSDKGGYTNGSGSSTG